MKLNTATDVYNPESTYFSEFCGPTQRFDEVTKLCKERKTYLPLGPSKTSNLRLSLHQNAYQGSNSFTLAFWIYLDPVKTAGNILQLDFDTQHLL